jgi:hypothetical protein
MSLTGSRKRRLATSTFILVLFLAGSLSTGTLHQARADASYSVNTIVNPGFESPMVSGCNPPISGWSPNICDDGNYYSTIATNSTRARSGVYSARLDVSNNSTAIRIGAKNVTLAHISLIQYLPPNTQFNNLTDRPDGLNLWFYLQPKFGGFPLFELRIRSGSIAEMDYIYFGQGFANTFSFPNSTTGSEGGKALKEFILPSPPMNQWIQFSRNVKQDWLAPMKLSNGLTAPGLPLNDTIYRFEVDAYFYRDPSTNTVYAETAWVDDVALYLGSLMPCPNFQFEDKSGNSVDGNINRNIIDDRGVQATIVPGTIIPSGSYTLRAYYQGYLIHTDPITPTTPAAIKLQMVPTSASRSNYLVFNSTITSATVLENSSSRIVFSVVGTGPSLIILKVPVKPLTVDRDGNTISNWTYNSTTSVVAIQTAQLGTFTLVYSSQPSSPPYYIGAIVVGALVVIAGVLVWRRRTHSSKSIKPKRNGKEASMKQFKPKTKKS